MLKKYIYEKKGGCFECRIFLEGCLECNGNAYSCNNCDQLHYPIVTETGKICTKCDKANQILVYEKNGE